MTPFEVLAAQPGGMRLWLGWMFAVNFSSLFFLRRVAARWVLAAAIANAVSMRILLGLYGTGHHLSLPHVVFWTPLLVYLSIKRYSLVERSPFGVWFVCLFVTDATSLALDYLAALKLLIP